jgi:L-alanine-DL-glutamate epimerase-like enolase superfamily enzyme
VKITGVNIYEYDAAYAHGPYSMSRGRVAEALRSLVVCVDTDDGRQGWAETCPNGRRYLPTFVEAEREALRLLAPAVVGLDPRNLWQLNAAMDDVLLASNAAKGALDMACWDLLGQAAGLPVCELLGGRAQDEFPLFLAAPVGPPETMAAFVEREMALGIRVIQVKVGDAPDVDVARVRAVLDAAGPDVIVIADANGGWDLASALLAARQLDGLPVRLEQPCRTIAECAELRRHTALPLILDEVVVTVADLMQARFVAGATGINLKPGRVGGFTKARAMRDAATGLGMTFTVDDTWGGAIVSTQNAHLAASCDPQHLTAATFFGEWVLPVIANCPRMTANGTGSAPTAPGLGIEVDLQLLGPPVIEL